MSHDETQMTSLSMLMGIQSGDPDATRRFHERYGSQVYEWSCGYARKARLPEQDAEDVAYELTMDMQRRLKSFVYDSKKGKFRYYLRTIVKNAISDTRKRNAKLRQMTDADEAQLVQQLNPEIDRDLLEFAEYHVKMGLGKDWKRKWDVFCAAKLDNCQADEIAERFEISTDNVYKTIERVRKHLEAKLKELDE